MKKVICINDKEFGTDGISPVKDAICNVRRAFIDDDNDPVYVLDNYSGIFSQRYFKDLPDTTSDEMKEETKEAIVNLETALP